MARIEYFRSRSRQMELVAVAPHGGEIEEHTDEQKGFYRVERSFGQFSRTLTLPKGVDPAAVTASFDRGVLEVRIPKPEAAKPRRIEISAADGTHTIEGQTA
jgi:HSP20 family protein